MEEGDDPGRTMLLKRLPLSEVDSFREKKGVLKTP